MWMRSRIAGLAVRGLVAIIAVGTTVLPITSDMAFAGPGTKKKTKTTAKATEKKKPVAKDDSDDSDSDGDKKKATKKRALFYMEKPAARTQTQKTPEERGGVNPCNTDDPGFGVYEKWDRSITKGQMLIPTRGGLTKNNKFDVVFHFHGHEAVRKEWVKVMDGAVLVGIDEGIGSGAYSSAFNNPNVFKDLVASVEKEVSSERGVDNAKVRHVGLMAWSAGYGAVQEILTQSYGKEIVDSVILLDGLHTGYQGDDLEKATLNPFVEFAKRAKAGKRFMYVSHSSIIPPGYASTTETENFLVSELGGKPKVSKPRKSDPYGLDLNSKFDAGDFHMRGFDGNDKMDHCANIGLARQVMKQFIKPRWKSPKGFGAKKK